VAHLNSKIHEVIVSTLNEDGTVHHAPMGISEVSNHFIIKPFKPSTTYDNLRRHAQCAISYTDDVRIFAGAVTGRRQWTTANCSRIECEYIEGALAHSELEVVDVEDDDVRACFKAAIIAETTHAPFRGFNRAQAAVIEAAVLVSRLNMLPAEKIKQEVNYHTIAIEKTAGDREAQAWGWLMNKIKQAGIELDD
jgi:hypothetical protein